MNCLPFIKSTTNSIMPKQLGARNTTPAERLAIIHMAKSLVPLAEIANSFNRPLRTVQQVLKNHKDRGHVEDLPRSGRPTKINDRAIRHLKKFIDSDRRQKLGDITHSLNTVLSQPVSPRTVSRVIHDRLEMRACHARRKPFLSEDHKKRRLAWSMVTIKHTMEEWMRVIWTDESSVVLGKESSAPLVWRRTHEAFDEKCILPSFKSGRSSVMIWGCIAYNRKGPLVVLPKDRRKGVDYVDLVLSKPLWDFYSILLEERGIVKVMEDGAPVHTCQVAKDFRNSHFLDIFPHPAQSPDMNPIEHVWYLIN